MIASRPVHSTQTPVRHEDLDLLEGPRSTQDGIPIIEVQRGQAPAPNPASGHKLVDFKFLQMILLGDREGTVRYRCANFKNGQDGERCWRDDFTNPRSAVAHINSHGQTRAPDYPVETLRLLIRLMNTYKRAGKRNYATLTAEELNRTKVPTLSGERWNAMQVSSLFGTHESRLRVRTRPEDVQRVREGGSLTTTTTTNGNGSKETSVPTTPAPTPVPDNATLAALDAKSGKLVKEAAALFDLHKAFSADLAEFVEQVGKKLAEAAARPNADPEVVEKAAKWDRYLELRKLIDG